jgi:hypothetical protein
MKSLTTLTLAALTLLGATVTADARPRHGCGSGHVHISSYRSCGTPVHPVRYIHGYNRCGSPGWGYRPVYVPRVRYCPPPVRHYYHRPVCPPVYHGHHGYHGHPHRGGVSISGSFRL